MESIFQNNIQKSLNEVKIRPKMLVYFTLEICLLIFWTLAW